MIHGKNIIPLKSNFIQKVLIPLDTLFDINNVGKIPKVQPQEDEIQDHNIGTEEHPKIVNLSKTFPKEETNRYVKLMNKFSNFFSQSYEYLKEYDTSIIHHTIPINLGEKPFREKLRG